MGDPGSTQNQLGVSLHRPALYMKKPKRAAKASPYAGGEAAPVIVSTAPVAPMWLHPITPVIRASVYCEPRHRMSCDSV